MEYGQKGKIDPQRINIPKDNLTKTRSKKIKI